MTAEAWLRSRAGEAPSHLLEAMVQAVGGQGEGALPDRLAEAALSLYSQVLTGTGGREDAFPLLTADALLTHAFEAQAELEPERLLEFADRWDGRRMAELLT